MSLFGSMYAGVSGLTGNTRRLGSISDNIANVNTIGYKTSKTDFSTLVLDSGLPGVHSPGGSRTVARMDVGRQGQVQSTTSLTDLAISGKGMFVVKNSLDDQQSAFTRAGSFSMDSDGYLRNTAGSYLQGIELDATGDLPATPSIEGLTAINLTKISGNASPTTSAKLNLNLPAAGGTAYATSPLTTSVNVYDSVGVAHRLDLKWTSTDTATGNWSLAVYKGDVLAGGAAPAAITTIPVTFNTDGTIKTPATTQSVSLALSTFAATPQSVKLDLSEVTSLAGPYSVSKIDTDGSSVGQLSGLSIGEDGVLKLLFSNGASRDAFQIPLATFPNVDGLAAQTGNLFYQSISSGNPTLTLPRNAGAGAIVAQALESSTVDIAEQLTDMIVTQNAYSANVKVLTTTDEMMSELSRIGR